MIRILRGNALSAGLSEDRMPLITFPEEYTHPVINNPDLVLRTVNPMQDILGKDKVIRVDPITAAEDFGKYGRTEEQIPIGIFWIGSVRNQQYKDHLEKGTFLPPLHNPSFAPDFEQTFRGGVAAMSRAVIDLFGSK